MRGGSYRPKEIPSSVECEVWFLLSCRFAGGTAGQRKPGSTRRINSSSGESNVAFGGEAVCEAGVIDDSARAEASARTSWRVRASKGTRRSGDEAVPITSPGSRSWYPVEGINWRPEEINRSGEFESS